jgi:hypothetical protein
MVFVYRFVHRYLDKIGHIKQTFFRRHIMIKNKVYQAAAYLSTVDTMQVVRAAIILGVFVFTLFNPQMVVTGPCTSGVGS